MLDTSLAFAGGAMIGGIAMFAAISRIAKAENRRRQARISAKGDPVEKLATARRYLGQIVTRESLTEARKIAHHALRETK